MVTVLLSSTSDVPHVFRIVGIKHETKSCWIALCLAADIRIHRRDMALESLMGQLRQLFKEQREAVSADSDVLMNTMQVGLTDVIRETADTEVMQHCQDMMKLVQEMYRKMKDVGVPSYLEYLKKAYMASIAGMAEMSQ